MWLGEVATFFCKMWALLVQSTLGVHKRAALWLMASAVARVRAWLKAASPTVAAALAEAWPAAILPCARKANCKLLQEDPAVLMWFWDAEQHTVDFCSDEAPSFYKLDAGAGMVGIKSKAFDLQGFSVRTNYQAGAPCCLAAVLPISACLPR